MNLEEMRAKFRKNANDLANDLSDSEVLAYLDRAYRFTVPGDVGEDWSETLYELQLITGTVTYEVPDQIIGPAEDSAAWIDRYSNLADPPVITNAGLYWVTIETDPSRYQWWFSYQSAAQARPTACLLYGRQIVLNRPPDQNYIMTIPSRGAPATGLTDSGLSNDAHAQAVVYGGVVEYLSDVEDAEGQAEAAGGYAIQIKKLRRYALVSPERRQQSKSF